MSNQDYQQLIVEHVGFAEGVARRFYREHRHEQLDFDDVKSAAYVGLCTAAGRFKAERGVSFRAYSYMRIRGSMYDMLRHDVSPFSSRRTVEKARASEAEHSGEEKKTTIVPSLQVSVCRIIEELGVQFDGTFSDNEMELTYLEECSPEEASTERAFRSFVSDHIERLPVKEREVVTRKYYNDQSFAEIAPHLNDVRTSWLCRIHTRALDRLRKTLQAGGVQEWLKDAA